MSEAALCPTDSRILGTLKVNRSEIRGFTLGVLTTLVGGGQVDVNFNEFSENDVALLLLDTNTNTTVTGNVFRFNSGVNSLLDRGYGIALNTIAADAPAQNRTVIHSNQFVDDSAQDISIAIEAFIDANATRTAHSMVISSNIFTLQAPEAIGMLITDVDKGVLIDNGFRGSALTALFLDSFSFDQPVSGWSVLENRFNSVGIDADIFFGFGVTDSLIGPQLASVFAPSPGSSGNTYLHSVPRGLGTSARATKPVGPLVHRTHRTESAFAALVERFGPRRRPAKESQ